MNIIKKLLFSTVVAVITMVAPSLTAEASESVRLDETQISFIEQFHEVAAELGYEYGLPWETIMAQGIVESSAGTSNLAITKNNLFGIGAYDSNPGAACTFESYESCWQFYCENIHTTPCYAANGALNYPDDPYGYIRAIKNAGYASSEEYVSAISYYIKAVEAYSLESGWESSAQIISRKERERAEEERLAAEAARQAEIAAAEAKQAKEARIAAEQARIKMQEEIEDQLDGISEAYIVAKPAPHRPFTDYAPEFVRPVLAIPVRRRLYL